MAIIAIETWHILMQKDKKEQKDTKILKIILLVGKSHL